MKESWFEHHIPKKSKKWESDEIKGETHSTETLPEELNRDETTEHEDEETQSRKEKYPKKETSEQPVQTEKIGRIYGGAWGLPLEGAIRGGKFAFLLPLQGLMAGLKYGLDAGGFGDMKDIEAGFKAGLFAGFLFDREKTNKMAERIFDKKEKKEKTKAKGKEEQKPTYAKELETKMKIKEIEIAYIKGLKENIMEQKARDSVTPQEYTMLTEEGKQEFKETTGKRGYENVWRTLRVHWIQEGGWTIDNEREFREVIDQKLSLRDILTQQEYDTFEKGRKKQKKLEEEHDANPANEDIEKSLEHIKGEMADIRNRKKIRENTMQWPQYTRGKKKGGASAEIFVVTEDDTEEDEEDND